MVKNKAYVPLFKDTPEPMDASELLHGLRNVLRSLSGSAGGRPPKYDDRKLAAVYELLRRCLGWSAEQSRGWIIDYIGPSENTIKRAGRVYKMMREYTPSDLERIAKEYLKTECLTSDDIKMLEARIQS